MAGSGALIDCCDFAGALYCRGWDQAAGVPCSILAGPIEHFAAVGRYEASANEGTALAGAAGVALGGRRRVVFVQNSGLGNLINPLASLVLPYGLPVLVCMSMRGWPDSRKDEPQHEVMGRAATGLLTTMGVWHAVLDGSWPWGKVLDSAEQEIVARRPAFLLVPPGVLGAHPAGGARLPSADLPGDADVAAAVSGWAGPNVVVSTTGQLSRHMFAAGDRPTNFYMQGSMGHAAAIALGYCAARPREKVVVLDGDGALLMHLGTLSTIGAARPSGLVHIVVNNGSYASTGGQPASSLLTDLAATARACGYRSAVTVTGVPDLMSTLDSLAGRDGPHCVVVRTRSAPGPPPTRPSATLRLTEIASRVIGAQSATAARP